MDIFSKLSLIVVVLLGSAKPLIAQNTECIYDKKLKAYIQVDQMPEYPGGTIEFNRFFGKNFKYPDTTEIQGNVSVSFIVLPNGKTTDFKVPHKTEKQYTAVDKEGLKMFKSMPDWKPGLCSGKNVPVQVSITVRVLLQER